MALLQSANVRSERHLCAVACWNGQGGDVRVVVRASVRPVAAVSLHRAETCQRYRCLITFPEEVMVR